MKALVKFTKSIEIEIDIPEEVEDTFSHEDYNPGTHELLEDLNLSIDKSDEIHAMFNDADEFDEVELVDVFGSPKK